MELHHPPAISRKSEQLIWRVSLGPRGISVLVNQSTNQSQQGLMLGGDEPGIEKGSNFDVSDRAARWKIRLMYDVCVHRLVVAAEIPSITIRTSGKLSETARHSRRSPCFELSIQEQDGKHEAGVNAQSSAFRLQGLWAY